MEVIIAGQRVILDPTRSLGKGGEADVYLHDSPTGPVAVKIYKQPTHPDFRDIPDPKERQAAQDAATKRIAEHRTKLPAFPTNLPPHVVSPIDLVFDKKGVLVGYTMRVVPNADVIMAYTNGKMRKEHPHLQDATISSLFMDLHATVGGLHNQDIVIGDFNDLNVLCVGHEAFVLDADSMQFGKYPCRVFTERMVDPRLCDPKATRPLLMQMHDRDSDWFAFALMLFESCFWVSPWGGIYTAPAGKDKLKPGERSLRGISVLHHEGITYPRPARKPELVPPELVHHFSNMFEKGLRGEFPRKLLQNMRWTTCTTCGAIHARSQCPICATTAPAAVIQKVTIKGTVTATRVFPNSKERGNIVHATVENGELKYVYHEASVFKREGGVEVIPGSTQRGMKFRISGRKTLIGINGQVVALEPQMKPERFTASTAGHTTQFDSNAAHTYWVDGERLQRDGMLGLSTSESIGSVLAGQTRFWMGPKFGFGFYQAGEIFRAFVFDGESRKSLNDGVQFPRITGNLVDVQCIFSSAMAWIISVTQQSGRLMHRCTLVNSKGEVVTSVEHELTDEPWLRGAHAACATTLPGKTPGSVRHALFVPTDDGIVRIEEVSGSLGQTASFPDTAAWVDAGTQLLLTAKNGIAAVKDDSITYLKIA